MYMLINGYLHGTTKEEEAKLLQGIQSMQNCVEARRDEIPLFKVKLLYM